MRKRRKKKLPGVEGAIALATRLGLRRPKGLDNIPAEAMTTVENPDQDREDALLAAVLQAMPEMDPATIKELEHIGDLRPGERRSASGAVIYAASCFLRRTSAAKRRNEPASS